MTEDEKAALADVYERAAEYLEEYGWDQEFGHDGGPRCFMGAISSVTTPHYFLAGRFAARVLELPPHRSGPSAAVGEWNDEDGRTKDEVINTLHALANKLR